MGLWRYLVRVPRASGQTQTRQGDRHLGMLSCPKGSLNKVVKSGGKRFGEAEGFEQMPLLTLRMCVFLCASVLLRPYAFLWWRRGTVYLWKPIPNLCIFVCLSPRKHVRGWEKWTQWALCLLSRKQECHLYVRVFNMCWLSVGNCCHGCYISPGQAKNNLPINYIQLERSLICLDQ